MIRYSRKTDIDQIKSLLYLCFGEMVNNEGAFNNIETGRYLCYIENEQIIAITGLCFDYEFPSYQITWTCTHPNFRHKGIMQKLFSRLLAVTDENIYCSCWKIGNSEKVNLQSLMNIFGFKKVVSNIYTRYLKHNCDKNIDCPYKDTNCYCGNDLYLRKYN